MLPSLMAIHGTLVCRGRVGRGSGRRHHGAAPGRDSLRRSRTAPLLFWACLLGCNAGTTPKAGDQADAAHPDAATPDTTWTPLSPAAALSQALAAAATIDEGFLLDRISVLAHDEMDGRDNNSPGGLAARAWLVADLKNQGLQPAGRDGYVQPFAVGSNLCAQVPGHDPALAGEFVVIGAHYDHLGRADVEGSQCKAKAGAVDLVCNGAIDNASGVAVAIALGRALAKHATLRRSLLVCLFDAEEDGLLGSKHFVQLDPLVPLATVAAMVSVDNVGSQIVPGEPSSFATDAEFSDALRAAVHAANDATGYTTWPVSSFFVGQKGGGRSDHLPFREAGVPVLFLGSGSSSVYHTPEDELAALDMSKLVAIARHAAVLVALVANAEARPDFVASPQPHLDDALALRSLADRVLQAPQALGLNDGQIELVQTWRDQLQAWIDVPPSTPAQWKSYQTLVEAIIAAVFVFAG